MKNKARVHRLPTEDARGMLVWGYNGIDLRYSAHKEFKKEQAHHLYITTDEEIKEGDWYLNLEWNTIKQYQGEKISKGWNKKIIATTDPSISAYDDGSWDIKNHIQHPYTLPQIPQSFIEEYCKAGGIDEVLVEHEFNYVNTFKDKHGMQYKKRILVSKLDSNNCIIIHPVEEKKYSREEIIDMISEFELVNPKLVSDGHGEFPDTYQFGEKNVIRFVDKYLK